ncbi:MAG: DUF4129 domain-containing protein, partial [Verrucomicrobia bacterium]|nr:DUF4129 domain-containing protein [Verrucomicrobiota bacterium]
YARMLRALDRLGCQRPLAQTPFEFLRQLEDRSSPVRHEARLITETFCATRYGHDTIDSLRKAQVEQALQRIRHFARIPAGIR